MPPEKPMSVGWGFRRLLAFQIKLALDALRDFALSPLSVVAFGIDVLLRRPERDSFYGKLMAAGRRSDRIINLFDEFSEAGDYTVDQTLSDVEKAVNPHWEEVQRRRGRISDDEDAGST